MRPTSLNRLVPPLKRSFRRIKTRWYAWRWHRLYPRRNFVSGIVSVFALIAALLYAKQVMGSHVPPQQQARSADPIVFITPSLGKPPGGLSSFDISGYEFVNGCHNPVHVQLALEAQGSASAPRDRYVGVSATLDGQIEDPTRSAYDFHEELVRRRGWQAQLDDPHTDPYSLLQTRSTGRPATLNDFIVDPTWHPYGKTFAAPLEGLFPKTSRNHDRVFFNEPVLLVTFRANWLMKRGFDTCYVRVPDITTSPNVSGEILRPRTASMTLQVNGGGSVDAGSSIPSPSDPRRPTWNCRIESDPEDPQDANCAAFAAVDEPGAEEKTQIRLLVVGAVIALAFALLVESALKFRWPLDEAGDESANDG